MKLKRIILSSVLCAAVLGIGAADVAYDYYNGCATCEAGASCVPTLSAGPCYQATVIGGSPCDYFVLTYNDQGDWTWFWDEGQAYYADLEICAAWKWYNGSACTGVPNSTETLDRYPCDSSRSTPY